MLTGMVFDNVELDQNRISRVVRLRHSASERISFHSIISGTPNGTLLLQISDDPVEDEALVSNWIDYTDSEVNILGVTQLLVNVKDITFRWAKLVYISVGSTGFITTNFVLVNRHRL